MLSISEKEFPACFKKAHICPIPKKGDKCNPNNYRPISIVSVVSKVFESIINEQLLNHLEKNNLLHDHQYGFRHSRSTGDLLAYVTDRWATALQHYGETHVVSLDISKAFDRVWHTALLRKLPSFGIGDDLSKWIESFLSDRCLAVRVKGILSQYFKTNAGVPQGCVISPTLFLLFINDLLSLTKTMIHSYADDTTLSSIISFDNQADSTKRLKEQRDKSSLFVNDDMITISSWGLQNKVRFNSLKTHSMFITKKRTINENIHLMDGEVLINVDSMTMLGVKIDNTLTWRQHTNSMAKRASAKLAYLFRARRYFTSLQLLLLYKAQIRPLMENCYHVWGGAAKSNLEILDKVQRSAIRLINDASLTDSLQSLSHRRQVAELCIFYRFYHCKASTELTGSLPCPYSANFNSRKTLPAGSFGVNLPKSRIDAYRNSFFPRVADMWNKVPYHVFPDAYDMQQFKTNLNSHLISQ
jgi:retron-type reverse transcriptase